MDSRSPHESRRRRRDPEAGRGRCAAAGRGAAPAAGGPGRAALDPLGAAGPALRGRAAGHRRSRAAGEGEPGPHRAGGDRRGHRSRRGGGARLGDPRGAALFLVGNTLGRGAVAQSGLRLHPAPGRAAGGGGPRLRRGEIHPSRGELELAPADRGRLRGAGGVPLRFESRLLPGALDFRGLARGVGGALRHGPLVERRGGRGALERHRLRGALRGARFRSQADGPQGPFRACGGHPGVAAGPRRAGLGDGGAGLLVDVDPRPPARWVGSCRGLLPHPPLPALRVRRGRRLRGPQPAGARWNRGHPGLLLVLPHADPGDRGAHLRATPSEGAVMTPRMTRADRNEATRSAATSWRRAGAIDDRALAAIEKAYPDERQGVGPVFRVLLFLFTLISVSGAFGFFTALNDAIRAQKVLPVLLLLFGAGLIVATEFQIT